MEPHGFYDEIGIALIYEGMIIGNIGMARKNNQHHFTKVDYKGLQYSPNVIASVLANQFKDEMDYSMLTKRKEEVVMLLKEGRTNQSIAK
jgi:DNA-binding NarL/FixJ family response regulator